MKKVLLLACFLLGGCATTQQQQLANQINYAAGAVVAGVAKACGWVSPIENAAAILLSFTGQGLAVEQAIVAAVHGICGAIAPRADVKGYIPKVNGIRVKGKPNT